MVAMFTDAKYDEIMICGIKKGSVFVSFMIKDYLIPKLQSSILQENQKEISDCLTLKHKVIKVVIQDDIIYKSGMSF